LNLIKKILLVIGIVFISIQFIRPVHNISNRILPNDISTVVNISDSVQMILKKACYDCHSNNTIYPWYSNIQPMGWLMATHIKQGKEELNFNEFGSYSIRKQGNKLNGIANSIRDNIMPLVSYKWMHKNAQLGTNEKTLIINWAQKTSENLSIRN
jgi:hypothetical protein